MIPGGDESRGFTLAQGVIANDGTGTPQRGNYIYGFSAQAKNADDEPPITRSGSVASFPRKSADVWELLRRCLYAGDQRLVSHSGEAWE